MIQFDQNINLLFVWHGSDFSTLNLNLIEKYVYNCYSTILYYFYIKYLQRLLKIIQNKIKAIH